MCLPLPGGQHIGQVYALVLLHCQLLLRMQVACHRPQVGMGAVHQVLPYHGLLSTLVKLIHRAMV